MSHNFKHFYVVCLPSVAICSQALSNELINACGKGMLQKRICSVTVGLTNWNTELTSIALQINKRRLSNIGQERIVHV